MQSPDTRAVSALEIQQYEIEPVWDGRQLFDALDRRDDKSIWEALRNAPSQFEFLDNLRQHVSTTTYQAGVKQSHSEKVQFHCALVLIPVILGKSVLDVVDSTDAVKPVIKQARAWLQEWFENKQEVSMINALVGYNEVCRWTPSVMREKLEWLAIKKPKTLSIEENFDFHLDEAAPELAFFLAAIHRPFERPRMPENDATENQVLACKLEGALQICSKAAQPGYVDVLVPDFAPFAICAGILQWIEAIEATAGIGRWDVEIVDDDLLVLHLEVGEEPQAMTPIPLRAHQLGLDGLSAVLSRVAELGTETLSKPS